MVLARNMEAVPTYTHSKNRSFACRDCPSQLCLGSNSFASSCTSFYKTFCMDPYGKPFASTNIGFFMSSMATTLPFSRFRFDHSVSSSLVSTSFSSVASSSSSSSEYVGYPLLYINNHSLHKCSCHRQQQYTNTQHT